METPAYRNLLRRRGVLSAATYIVASTVAHSAAGEPSVTPQSLMSLLVEPYAGGKPLGTATGFVVRGKAGPLLLTNRHVVTLRALDGRPLVPGSPAPDELRINHNRAGAIGSWLWQTEPLYQSGKARWFDHPVLKEKADIVALPLSQMENVELHPYDLAGAADDGIMVGPTDTISVIGFPFGVTVGGAFAIWSTGFVASEPSIDYVNLPVFLIDCRSRQGQSGSPVLAYRVGSARTNAYGGMRFFPGTIYKFLGIYSGRINAESDLGLVWKTSAVLELLEAASAGGKAT